MENCEKALIFKDQKEAVPISHVLQLLLKGAYRKLCNIRLSARRVDVGLQFGYNSKRGCELFLKSVVSANNSILQ